MYATTNETTRFAIEAIIEAYFDMFKDDGVMYPISEEEAECFFEDFCANEDMPADATAETVYEVWNDLVTHHMREVN